MDDIYIILITGLILTVTIQIVSAENGQIQNTNDTPLFITTNITNLKGETAVLTSNTADIIASTSNITVTYPNGGEKWIRGTTKQIKWSYTGTSGYYVKIELFKSGILNRVINTNTANDGTYNWVVPSTQTLGTDYKIKVTSTSNAAYTDTSNNNFIISNPYITVISPNGGENWGRGTVHTISWSSAGSTGTYVKIELFKSGVLNRVISSSTPNDGSQSWTVPSTQTVGSDYKIKVTSTNNVAPTDTSNNNFIIENIDGIYDNFENGHIGTVTRSGTTSSPIFNMNFGDHTIGIWFHIKLYNLKNKNSTFILNSVDLNNWFPDNTAKRNNLVVSHDKRNWNKITGHLNITTGTFKWQYTPQYDEEYIAFFLPYTNWQLDEFLNTYTSNPATSPYINVKIIGTTPFGRNQKMVTITDSTVPDTNKKVIWILYREDASETLGSYNAIGAIKYLLSSSGYNMRKKAIFKLFPIVSVDGVAIGSDRGISNNFSDIYLTREWTKPDDQTPKEILNIKNQVRAWKNANKPIHLIGRQHSWYFQTTKNLFGSSQQTFNNYAQNYFTNTIFGNSDSYWPPNTGRFQDFIKSLYPNVVYYTTEETMVNTTAETAERFGVSTLRSIADYMRLN